MSVPVWGLLALPASVQLMIATNRERDGAGPVTEVDVFHDRGELHVIATCASGHMYGAVLDHGDCADLS